MTDEQIKTELKDIDTADLCNRIGIYISLQEENEINNIAYLSLRELEERITNLTNSTERLYQKLLEKQQVITDHAKIIRKYEAGIKKLNKALADV